MKNTTGKDLNRFYPIITVVLFILWMILTLRYLGREGFGLLTLENYYNHPSLNRSAAPRLTAGNIVTGKFRAQYNNLGIVLIRFDTHFRINQDQLEFRIRHDGSSDWIYRNTYKSDQFQPNDFFPFGFPSQVDSVGKDYEFQIESLGGGDDNSVSISKTEPVFAVKYIYGKVFLTNIKNLEFFIPHKLENLISDTRFMLYSFSYTLPLLIFLSWTSISTQQRKKATGLLKTFFDNRIPNVLEQKKYIFPLFLILAFLSFRDLMFARFDGIGHNWDWGFPIPTILFQNIFKRSFYSWNDFNMGRELVLQSQLVVDLVISNVARFFSTKVTILVVFYSVVFISLVNMKSAVDHLISKRSNFNYLPALLYAFSPFLFNEMIGGSWYMWISYAFAPLMLVNLVLYSRQGKITNLIGFLLPSFFVIISLQNFVSMEAIAVTYILLDSILNHEHVELRVLLIRLTFSHLVLVIVNLYWITPFIIQSKSFYSMVTNSRFTGNFNGVMNSTQNIISISSVVGYLDRNMYAYSLPDFVLPLFYIVVFIFWLIIGRFIYERNSSKLKKFIPILLLFILSFLIVKGGNHPFTRLTMDIFKGFPLMSLYRSPQHLMFIPAFLIPLLIAFPLHFLDTKAFGRGILISLYLFGILIWTSGWWINGDLGKKILSEKFRDHIDSYSLPPELAKIYQDDNDLKLNHRYLALPTVCSPQYLENDFQSDSQGGQPELEYLKNSTFCAEFNQLANTIDNHFCENNQINYINLLSLTSVRYLSLRSDIYPRYSKCGNDKSWNFSSAQTLLGAETKLKLIDSGNNINYYRLSDDQFVPEIYIPKSILLSELDYNSLPSIVSQKDYQIGTAIFFKQNNEPLINNLTSLAKQNDARTTPVVEYKKINSTKYRLVIHGAHGLLPLIFNSNFHQNWFIYPSAIINDEVSGTKPSQYKINENNLTDQASLDEVKTFIKNGWLTPVSGTAKFISKIFFNTIQNDNLVDGHFSETWMKTSLNSDEAAHITANGYANSWILDTNKICQHYQICNKNADDTYDVGFVLEFWPQRLFFAGIFISLGGILLISFAYVLSRIVVAKNIKKK